jgi:hypothetical protein
VHCESLAVVHVSDDVQPEIAEQVGHVSATPFCRYRPPLQVVHCESVAVVHVSDDEQPVIPVHGLH